MEQFGDASAFFIEVVELPDGLGTVPCSLYGPSAGDDPIPESKVHYAVRGDRSWASRLINESDRQVNHLVVIAGPHEDKPCVLFTVYGGGSASPQEPFDDISGDKLKESLAFWKDHALSA